MMNEGDTYSLSCCDAKTTILTRWLSSILKAFKWIQGTRYGLECTGSSQYEPYDVDKFQVFHQTSCHSPVALKANLLFDVHYDE